MENDALMEQFFGHICENESANLESKQQDHKKTQENSNQTPRDLPTGKSKKTAKSNSIHQSKQTSNNSHIGATPAYIPVNFVCPKCGNWVEHTREILNHRSCICSLLERRSVCCFAGYNSLIKAIPHLILYAPTPFGALENSQHIDERGVIFVQQEDIACFASSCANLKHEVISQLAGQFCEPVFSIL